ncbi:hypothetical protein K469DRAFT_671634 [Zopfia rhizophila CBS 207.26]|uniref:Tat pathway signal sequence n=1 Tax=Zopfia rhizophila CBS 207.26 TaxID=1314779 RepID=A0A6A6DPV2_9PEZI|nr:hypothetical protein K469DRAFT_671634 [Zopfia rhizophila CBS 207.26]
MALQAPANHVVRYKNVVFKKGFITDMSDYQGWPNDERDALWSDLYRHGMPVQVPASEAPKLPNKTAHYTVKGFEDDYMVGIDVFHQLHCLNVIRRSFYPQRYPEFGMWHKNGTLNMVNWVHLDHCIESIRQSLTCSSDVSPMSLNWLPSRSYMMLSMETYHRCRDFDGLREWAKSRNHGEYSTRKHVENGRIVDYQGTKSVLDGLDPEELRKVRFDLPDEVKAGLGIGEGEE